MLVIDRNQHELLRWSGYFLAGNILLIVLSECSYVLTSIWIDNYFLPIPNKVIFSVLLILSQLGHATLALTPAVLLLSSILLIHPKRHFILLFYAVFFVIFSYELYGDMLAYGIFHQHINTALRALPTAVYQYGGIMLGFFILFELLSAYLWWHYIIHKNKKIQLKKTYKQLKNWLTPSATKRELLRYCMLFCIANIPLCWVFGIHYLHAFTWHNTTLTVHGNHILQFFMAISYVGQLACIALLPCILLLPLVMLLPVRRCIFMASILIGALTVSLLLSDSFIYNLFHYHLNSIILNLFLHATGDHFFAFSSRELCLSILGIAGVCSSEILLASYLWSRIILKKKPLPGKRILLVITGLSLYCSYTLTAFAINQAMGRYYLEPSRALPLYTEMLSTLLPVNDGRIGLERAFELKLWQPAQVDQPLHYPLQTLAFKPPQQHLNVVIILIDAWRYDMLDPIITPNLYQFAHQSWEFKQHFSGANSTGPGIFSLFYGLPAFYWTSMETQHRGPLLLDKMLQEQYEITIPASSNLTLPTFHKNVFVAVPHFSKEHPILDDEEHDSTVTNDFQQFIKQHKQPFMSFLYYSSVHSYCGLRHNFSPFKPATVCDRLNLDSNTDPIPYLNRYKNALVMLDAQIGQLIASLKQQHLMQNTVVIITGDHGEEFNENHLNYWGHASNFTHYQMQTPLIVHWPNAKPKAFTHMTTHYDIAPTLMQKLFGCTTAPDQYSMGTSLFDTTPRPDLIASSYIGLGIITKQRITTIYPTGIYQISDLNGQPIPDAKPDAATLHSLFHNLRRFYW